MKKQYVVFVATTTAMRYNSTSINMEPWDDGEGEMSRELPNSMSNFMMKRRHDIEQRIFVVGAKEQHSLSLRK
jgi:hypothetical protein